MTKQKLFYKEEEEKHSALLEKAKGRHRFFTIARLFSFLLIPLSWYLIGWSMLLLVVLTVETILFIYLVNKWLDAKLEKEKEELYIQLNRNELALLEGDWSNFDGGIEFKAGQHPFANDMDLFGPKSVFQYINRTVLPLGKQRLATTLSVGAKDRKQNQFMILELVKNMQWLQKFIVESKVHLKDENRQHTLAKLKEFEFKGLLFSILKWVLPIVTLTSIVLYNLDFIKSGHLIVIGIGVLIIIGTKVKVANKWMNLLHDRSERIEALAKQLKLFSELELTTEQGQQYKSQLFGASGMQAGLDELIVIRKRSEFRMNVMVGLLLNYLFAWDFHLLHQSKKWHANFAQSLDKWESDMAEIEVWISGAVYMYNRGETCFTEFNEEGRFNIQNLGHPFVPTSKQVCNHFKLDKETSFLIITGPNMAGKSTYLRSVGLAIISANAGFPVLAESCTMSEMELYSSMRTSDDLTVESSYFHAELTRLRFIVDAIESGKKVFVILDEILKGTNSKDKEQGSAAFMLKLNAIGAKGIIATHDLSLTNLSNNSNAFRNVYFDSTINGDNLTFDYKVRDGVCQNMNASFLLKQMNLV